MNWLDIIILVIISFSTFTCLRKGIIKAALSLAGLVVGIILAGRYYAILGERLTFTDQETLAQAAAFAIIFIGIMIIASVIAGFLKWGVSIVGLGWVNRLSGAVFGLIMGTMFCGALLAIWIKFLGTDTPAAESTLTPLLLGQFQVVLALLPDEFDMVRSFFQ